MRPLAAAIALAVLTLPAYASSNEQPKPNTNATTLSPPPQTQEDSPLVRAAKASGRLNKKPGLVITNDTLTRTGGHFTTGSAMPTLPAPIPPKVDDKARYAAADRQAREVQEKLRKAEAAKAQAIRRAAADYNGETVEQTITDPAMLEHTMQQMTSTQPQTQPAAKPPQN
jgi:hypothetical protein